MVAKPIYPYGWTQVRRTPCRLARRQALIMRFSDIFAVIGVVLAIAAVVLLLTPPEAKRERIDSSPVVVGVAARHHPSV